MGGDPIVGRILASLLQTAGYDARYTDMGFPERPGALDGVGVVLLAPPWSGGDRDVVLGAVGEARSATRVPVLEIGVPDDEAEVRPDNYVPWPCRTEELQRRIEAALQTALASGDA